MLTQRPNIDTPENAEFRMKITKESVQMNSERMLAERVDASVKRHLKEQAEGEKRTQSTQETTAVKNEK